MITDMKSPIAYGYDGTELPVYFNQAPVLNAAGGGFGGFGGGRGGAPGTNPNAGIGQNVTPNAAPLRIQPFEADTQRRRPPGRGERPAGGRRWRRCGRWRSSSASPSTTRGRAS